MHSIMSSDLKTKIEWKDIFSVGVDELDTQHRGLLDLINELGDLAEAQDAN